MMNSYLHEIAACILQLQTLTVGFVKVFVPPGYGHGSLWTSGPCRPPVGIVSSALSENRREETKRVSWMSAAVGNDSCQ